MGTFESASLFLMVEAGDFVYEQLGENTLRIDKNTGEAWVLATTGFDYFWSHARHLTDEERHAERRRVATRTQRRD